MITCKDNQCTRRQRIDRVRRQFTARKGGARKREGGGRRSRKQKGGAVPGVAAPDVKATAKATAKAAASETKAAAKAVVGEKTAQLDKGVKQITGSISDAHSRNMAAIQEGIARAKELIKTAGEGVKPQVTQELEKQGIPDVTAEETAAEINEGLAIVAKNEAGFVTNMLAATAAEGVSEVPVVGPMLGEAIEGVWNQGKAVINAKAEIDDKMRELKEKQAKLAQLHDLGHHATDEAQKLTEEIGAHGKEITELENKLASEAREFGTAVSRHGHKVNLIGPINAMNGVVETLKKTTDNPAKTKELEDAWVAALTDLDTYMKANPPERTKLIADFKDKSGKVLESLTGVDSKCKGPDGEEADCHKVFESSQDTMISVLNELQHKAFHLEGQVEKDASPSAEGNQQGGTRRLRLQQVRIAARARAK